MSIAHRLPLGPVWFPAELLDDPHMRARDFFHPTTDSNGKTVFLPRLPVRWNGTHFDPGAFETTDTAPGMKAAP